MNQFLFGVFPYIAFAMFLVATILRYKFDQYGWAVNSSQFLEKKPSVLLNLFHVSIILLFFTHILGLFTPPWLYGVFISHATKQALAIYVGGSIGVVCFVAVTWLFLRKLTSPRIRSVMKTVDLVMLLFVYATLIVGLISLYFSWQHPNGENLAELAKWTQHLITFQSDTASYMEDKDLVFKIHVLLGMGLFLIFPYTKLVHILTIPIGYIFRKYTQIVRSK